MHLYIKNIYMHLYNKHTYVQRKYVQLVLCNYLKVSGVHNHPYVHIIDIDIYEDIPFFNTCQIEQTRNIIQLR